MFCVMLPASARTAACAPVRLHGAAWVQTVPPPAGEAHSVVWGGTVFGDADMPLGVGGAPTGGAGARLGEACAPVGDVFS